MKSFIPKDLLAELISIPSPFFHEEEIAGFLEGMLQSLGAKTYRQPVKRIAYIDGERHILNHYNVLAEIGKGEKSFLLYAHMDTVPVVGAWYDLGLDPFKPIVKNGRLYGLGASDMKAGIVAILSCVEILKPKGFKLKVCFGVDEENESQGGHVLVNSEFIKDCAGCIVPEVGSGKAKPALGNIITGRHGRTRIGVRIRGRAAHASTPEHIINPIPYAYEFIKGIKKISVGNDPDMPPGNVTISGIHSESGGLSSPEECIVWFENLFSHPQTKELLLSQYKKQCKNLNRKFGEPLKGEFKDRDYIYPYFSLIDPADLSPQDLRLFRPRSTPFMEPWKIEHNHPLVKCAKQAAKKVTGNSPLLTCGKSNADENYIGQLVPTVVIPPTGGGEHQGGEYVELDALIPVTLMMKDTIESYMEKQV